MDHSHMNHGGMDHGDMDHGDGGMDMCSMSVRSLLPPSNPPSHPPTFRCAIRGDRD